MGKIYVIRHGETDANNSFRFQGHTDNGLNAQGQRQAAALGKHFAAIDLSGVYSSSLLRARQTAQAIAALQGLEVVASDDLREIKMGEWEGKNYDEIFAADPRNMQNFLQNPAACVIPGGETFAQLITRISGFFKNLINTEPDGDIAVISHGGAIRAELCFLLGLDLSKFWTFSVGNCSTTCIGNWRECLTLEYVNDTHYLTRI